MFERYLHEIVADPNSRAFHYLSRRRFLRMATGAALGVCVPDMLWGASEGELAPFDTRAARRFSVRDFGAKGDGNTDDSTAFRKAAAAAAGGVLFVPAGIYLISAAVPLPSNIVIIGNGHDSVISGTVNQYLGALGQGNITLQGLQFVTSVSVPIVFSNSRIIKMLNCHFNGKLTNREWYLGGMGVRFNGCHNIAVVDSEFIDYNNAIYFDKYGKNNSDLAVVKGCRFLHTGRGTKFPYPAQVYQYNCDHLTVDECMFLNILPGSAPVAGRQSYAVYEGDGTAVETVVKNCRDVITQQGFAGLHTGILTSQNKTTTISNNRFDFDRTSHGFAFKNGGREVVSFSRNQCSGAAFLAMPAGDICSVIVEDNDFKNIGLGFGTAAVRIGASGRKASKATIRGNHIADVQGGGIMINLCNYATVAENRILNVNTLNTAYSGNNEWQVSGVSFYGSNNGLVSGNQIENTQDGSGHAKFGIAMASRQHNVDVRPDNVSLRMETQAVLHGVRI